MANLKDELRVIGNCPFCGTQLGFGHLPSQCEFNDAKPSTEWIAKAAIEIANDYYRMLPMTIKQREQFIQSAIERNVR